jgi:hypothetical protein
MTLVARMEAQHAQSYMTPYEIGVVYVGLGNAGRAFEWFSKACDDRDPDILMLNVEPLMDGVRGDSRFAALVKRMHLEH